MSREELRACVEREDALQDGIKAYEALLAQRKLDDSAKLEAEKARLNAEMSRYNADCAGRPYNKRDKQQALADYQARKLAAASAGPFEAGVKAFERNDYAEALSHWLPLAEQGRGSAQFNLAVMYEQGLGVGKDEARAARWFVAAATSGIAGAQLKAGSLYETGQGVARDLSSASYWYGEAANSKAPNDADVARQAKDRLARLPAEYRLGAEHVVDFEGGRFVLRRAANKECVVALQGEVTPSANLRFEGMIEKAKAAGCARPLTLLLESPGGSVDAGLALARSVHGEGMRTIARYECASSCANIFLAGRERVLSGARAAIGLHQISQFRGNGDARTQTCVTARDDPSVQAVRRYVRFVLPDTAEEVIRIAMATPCKEIEWVRSQRALDLQIATRIEAPNEDIYGPREERLSASGAAPR